MPHGSSPWSYMAPHSFDLPIFVLYMMPCYIGPLSNDNQRCRANTLRLPGAYAESPISSYDDLSPIRRQTNTWTKLGLSSFGSGNSTQRNYNLNSHITFKKIRLQISPAKRWPFSSISKVEVQNSVLTSNRAVIQIWCTYRQI